MSMKRIMAATICLICLAGCALGESNPEIRGYDADLQYQYAQLGTYPYEEDGTVAPLVWRVLARYGDQAVMITESLIDNYQMILVDNYPDSRHHKFSYKNLKGFWETDLYRIVNGEMTETILRDQDFSDAIILRDVYTYETAADQLAGIVREDLEKMDEGAKSADRFFIPNYKDMMNTDYGFPHTKAGNTVEQEGEVAVPAAGRRKAWGTPYATNKVLYEDWSNKGFKKLYLFTQYGDSSPYWVSQMRLGYYMAGIIGGNGHLSWSGMGDVQKGVRPMVMLDLSRLTVAGGSGTLEDPWRMELKEAAE